MEIKLLPTDIKGFIANQIEIANRAEKSIKISLGIPNTPLKRLVAVGGINEPGYSFDEEKKKNASF